MFEVSENWNDPMSGPLVSRPLQDYVVANALPAMLLGAVGLHGLYSFALAGVLIAALVVAVPFVMPVARTSPQLTRLLFVLIAGGPLLPILFHRIGGYDAAFLAAIVVAAMARDPRVRALGWLGAGFQQSQNAVVAAAFLLAFLVLAGRARKASVLPVLAVGAGWLLSQAWIAALGVQTLRTDLFFRYPLSTFVDTLIASLPLSIFGVLGIGWVVLLDSSVRGLRETRVLLLLAIVASLTLPLVALDASRIPALAMLPVVLTWAVIVAKEQPVAVVEQLWRRYAVAAVVVPVVMVMNGVAIDYGYRHYLGFRAFLLGL